jgi:hypothetical protein
VLKVKLKDQAKFVEMGAKYCGLLQERSRSVGTPSLSLAVKTSDYVLCSSFWI